jgi:hypothetical protein
MFRLNLGSSVTAFEIEGDADRVGSLNPTELIREQWPAEVVENFRRYQERVALSDTAAPDAIVAESAEPSPDRPDEHALTSSEG